MQWLAFYWKSQQRDVPHQICRILNKISDIAKLLAAVMFFLSLIEETWETCITYQGSFFPLSLQFSSVLMLKITLSLQLLWRKRKKMQEKLLEQLLYSSWHETWGQVMWDWDFQSKPSLFASNRNAYFGNITICRITRINNQIELTTSFLWANSRSNSTRQTAMQWKQFLGVVYTQLRLKDFILSKKINLML